MTPADNQRVEPRLDRALECPVFDLDGHVTRVSRVAECPEEGAPADVAQAGNLGGVPELGIGKDAVLVERQAVDPASLACTWKIRSRNSASGAR